MRSPFKKFLNKDVRLVMESKEVAAGKLVSIEGDFLLLADGGSQHLVRQDDVKEARAESKPRYLYNVRIGRITCFDPASNIGHIQERGTGRDWSFSGEVVRDALLSEMLLTGKKRQLVKFLPLSDFASQGSSEVGEVKPVSHHALKAQSLILRFFYEMSALAIFACKNHSRGIEVKEHRGFVCEFERHKAVGLIREDGTDARWSFYGNDLAEKSLFDRVYSGELGMSVSFFGHRRSSPEKVSVARGIKACGTKSIQIANVEKSPVRTASGRVTAYYIDRGFGFVKEVQSNQIWYFNRQSLSGDAQLQDSLMRGELNQFVTLSGDPRPSKGQYPSVSVLSMPGIQSRFCSSEGKSYSDADRAEKRGDLRLAESIYQGLLSDAAHPARSYVVRGYAYLLNRLNRVNEAIDLVESNRNLFDARSRLGMLSDFYRKACRYDEAANIFKQMAFNLGLPKNDEKRIAYLLSGAECFCEGRNFHSARDLLLYLPVQFDRTDLKFVAISKRIEAGLKDDPQLNGDETSALQNQGFQYPALAQEHLDECKYVGLPANRLAAGDFCKSDVATLSKLLKGASANLSPALEAEYYLTMARISDDIGESAMYYLYQHFLCSAVDAMFRLVAKPPQQSIEDDVLCDVVQAFCCVRNASNTRFFFERLWYVTILVFCSPKESVPMDVIWKRFVPGSLVKEALSRISADHEAAARFFQALGIVRRNIPEEGFAFLIDAMKNAGWKDVDERSETEDSYLCVEGVCNKISELRSIDERSLLDVLNALTSVGDLPSTFDREIFDAFLDLIKTAAEYAARQSNFVKCEEVFNQILYKSGRVLDSQHRSVMSACLFQPAVRHLMNCLRENYDKHKSIKPELVLDLKYDDPETQMCVAKNGLMKLRFGVRMSTEAAPPVRNLRFQVRGDDVDSPRAECVYPQEFAGSPIDIEIPPFMISDRERELGEFSIEMSVDYETTLGELCKSSSLFSVRLASSSLAWEKIDPNPYLGTASGAHVDNDRMFFGRTKLVADIVEVLRYPGGGQCFVLYGQKRSGKSSVMETVCRRLIHTEEHCIVSKLSAQGLVGTGGQRSLFARFALMIASRVRASFAEHRFSLPSDFPAVSEIYDNPMGAVEYFARMVRGEGLFWIVAIDEFTSIHQESPDMVSSFMHNWKAMLQERLFNALIIGQDTMPKFMDEHPNDFCVSHNVRLPYLTKEECFELASKPIELGDGRSRYQENSLDKIFDWTLGSPFLVQKFCHRLVEHLNANGRTYVVDADIDAVAQSMYSGCKKMPELEFDSFITAGDETWVDFNKDTLRDALSVVAKESRITGWAPMECVIGDDDDEESAKELASKVVEDLVKRDALERVDGKLKVPVRLFAEWLRVNM